MVASIEPDNNPMHRLMSRVTLEIWETMGDERVFTMATLSIRGCNQDQDGVGVIPGRGNSCPFRAIQKAAERCGMLMVPGDSEVTEGDYAVEKCLSAIANHHKIYDYGILIDEPEKNHLVSLVDAT